MQFAFCVFKFFHHGGISRDFAKVAAEALARGHSVRVYTLRAEAPLPAGVELVEMPQRALTNHSAYRKFAAAVAQHLIRYPVDLVVGFNKMPGLDAYYAGDSCFEEKAVEQRGAYYRYTPRYRHFAAFERAVFDPRHSTKVLTLVEAQVAAFKKYYATPEQRFFIVPPGLDPALCEDPPDTLAVELRRELGIKPDTTVLLFVGSGFIKKGLDRVIEGISDLSEARRADTVLLVVGQDNSAPFVRLAERLEVADRVRFLGGRNDVRRFLFAADGLVLPAYDEAGGIVLLEAIVAGLPVLTTANCGYAPQVDAARAGIVLAEPFDRETFAKSLDELLGSEHRPAWRKSGRAFGRRADWFALAARSVELLERFATGELQPVVALCIYRFAPFDARSEQLRRMLTACRERGYHVRVYAGSWHGPVPAGVELVNVPLSIAPGYKRFGRFARRVQKALSMHPAHCVVGFDKMAGLDVHVCLDGPVAAQARRMRTRRYRGSHAFKSRQDAERGLLSSDADLIYPNPAAAERLALPAAPERITVLANEAPAPRGQQVIRGDEQRMFLFLLIAADLVAAGFDRVLSMLASVSANGAGCSVRVVTNGAPTGEFERAARNRGVREHIRFDVADGPADVFDGADAFLHVPYGIDNNPLVLDALSRGVPVITVADCGYAPHVRRSGLGVVLDAPYRQGQLNAVAAAASNGDPAEEFCRRQAPSAAVCGSDLCRFVEVVDRRIASRGQALSA